MKSKFLPLLTITIALTLPQTLCADKKDYDKELRKLEKKDRKHQKEMTKEKRKHYEEMEREDRKKDLKYQRERMKKEHEREKEKFKEYKERGKSESKRQDIYKNKHKNGSYDNYEKYDRKPHYEEEYPGKGKSDSEYIEEKVDQTKKNWIDKVFDVFN